MEIGDIDSSSSLLRRRLSGVDEGEEIFNAGEGSDRRPDGQKYEARPISSRGQPRQASNCDQAAGLFFVALAVISVAFAILFGMGVFGPNQYFAAGFMALVAIPLGGIGAITLWPSRSPYQTLGDPSIIQNQGFVLGHETDNGLYVPPTNEGEKEEEEEVSLIRRKTAEPPAVEEIETNSPPVQKSTSIGSFVASILGRRKED